jgi:DNA-directed RNA polymerase subunit M
LEFCKKCGTILKLYKKSQPELHCPRCGFRRQIEGDDNLKTLRISSDQRTIGIVDRKTESNFRPFPIVKAICPKCGFDQSETWTIPVGSEGTTSLTFFRCVSCGFTQREAG